MQSSLKTDVVIVGAGPTGLSLAAQLTRFGIDFILIERNKQTTELSKALVIQARTLEIFREIGLDKRAIDQGSTAMAFNMYSKGHRKARLDLNGLGKGQSAYPFVLSLEQSKTEKLLVSHLADHGKTVRWGCEFIDFEQNDSGVTVRFKNPHGGIQAVEAAFLAGCDGASSPVRHAAGMNFKGDTIPKIFYVADAVLTSDIVNTDELSVFLIAKGFVLFFPMEGKGHYRIIGVLPDVTEEEAEHLTFADIEPSIKKQLNIKIDFQAINWFSHYKVHSRMANTFRNSRCFILGDAAHIHTPAGGQGMNTGIQDAYNLAWKLAFSLQKPNEELLESYNAERMHNARRLLRTTDTMFDFMAGRHWYSDFFRLRIFPRIIGFISTSPAFNKLVFPLLSQIGISYPDSVLSIKGKSKNIKAGDRMPYFKLADGSDVYQYLTAPKFKLLHFGKHPDFSVAEKFDIGTQSFGDIKLKFLDDRSECYFLLRPDNHISYIGNDLKLIEAILAAIIHQKSKP